jgi:subtilase family serine protease
LQGKSAAVLPEQASMKSQFNHAADDSPRSGSSKQVAPLVFAMIVVAIVAIIIWFAIKA